MRSVCLTLPLACTVLACTGRNQLPSKLTPTTVRPQVEQLALARGSLETGFSFSVSNAPFDLKNLGAMEQTRLAKSLGWVETRDQGGKRYVTLSAEGKRLAPSWRPSVLNAGEGWVIYHFEIGKVELLRVTKIEPVAADRATVSFEWRIAPTAVGQLMMKHGLKAFDRIRHADCEFYKHDYGWSTYGQGGGGGGLLGPR